MEYIFPATVPQKYEYTVELLAGKILIEQNIKCPPASPGRRRVGSSLYVKSLLGLDLLLTSPSLGNRNVHSVHTVQSVHYDNKHYTAIEQSKTDFCFHAHNTIM